MLDTQMLEQLKTVFAPIEKNITLIYDESNHPDQKELVEMLESVSSTSAKIKTKCSGKNNVNPFFHIECDNKPVGISMLGIPGGHEFTSLILAILNSASLGKVPDNNTIRRIKNLKGPIEIQTYLSLTCENCPEVVQTLNQIATLHGNFKHTMIDGGYVQDEIKKLGIQGVPSLVVKDKMIHSGRITLLDMLTQLENIFGTNADTKNIIEENLGHFDVVVVGGGPAGTAAAIYSVRKGLKTALITEKVGGQVSETKGIENLISVTYTEGPQLAAQLNQHMAAYPIQILENRRVKQIKKTDQVHLLLESNETLTATSVIVATGAKWRELGIQGEKEYMGRGVAYCPHCDGPFYKGKKVAVVGGGNSGVEAAIDLAGIVREVVLFEYQDQLKADQILVNKLKSLPNVSIVTNAKTMQIHGDGQKVVSVEYENKLNNEIKKEELDGIFIQIGLLPNSQFLKDVVELSKFGEVITDNKGRTSVPGIYAAGDVTTTPYKQIIIAMGEGARTALAAFEDRMHA